MLFKKLEMHGFKSFAEPVVIEFKDGITGIVGPNGSGKSNISDAIRWVLGEQSPKMLRGGKMEEVIFNGTSSRKLRGMAEVTLVIDNSDGQLPIDYKEVAITRRMYRSGESEYRINGNQCRLRDIRELIMDTGIGVDGYSIIGQGKISDIISNKTESRREIFEEAAGIVAYRTKKAETERKLAATENNMERVRDIVGEIEGRIDGLREDSIRATEYLELREKQKKLDINIILKNVENLEGRNRDAENELKQAAGELAEGETAKDNLDRQLEEKNSRNRILETMSEEERAGLLRIIEEYNALSNKEEVDREKLAAIDDNLGRLDREIESLEESLCRETENRNSTAAGREALDREVGEAEARLAEKTMKYNTLAGELAEASATADGYRNDIFECSRAISTARAEIGSLEVLTGRLAARREDLARSRAEGESSNRETLDDLGALRRERDDLRRNLDSMKEDLEDAEAGLQREKTVEKSLRGVCEELKITLGRLTSRMKTIQEMESNYEGYNNAVRFIMKSDLTGIHGVVADLIKVPEGYETAVETALGASIQNVVCEDDGDAKRAVGALKANSAGRMTFLPVKSIRASSRRDESLRKEKGFVGFGPECVSFDERYRNIAEYLLGRVVIVDNMDNAVRLSKKSGGMRVVTLEGEIINAGGAITGGRYRNRTANILDRKSEITRLEKEISEKTAHRERDEKRLEETGDRIRELTETADKLRRDMGERERSLIFKENEIRASEEALASMRTAAEKGRAELEDISREEEKTRSRLRELEEKIAEETENIREKERLGEEAVSAHESIKAGFDLISEEITAARIDVRGSEERRAHADDILTRIDERIGEIRKEIEDKTLEKHSLDEDKKNILSDGGTGAAQLEAKAAAREEAEEKLEAIATERAALSEEIRRLREERDSLEESLGRTRDRKYELDVRKARNETQLESYKEKLWEEFEVSYVQAMEFRSEDFVMSSAVRESRQIKNRIRELGEVNVGAIEEYESVRERYEFLKGQEADIQAAMDNLLSIVGDMDKTIRTRFRSSFDTIVVNFEEQFRELFGGGHAELRLSDENNPLESDIDIVAQPPGKKLQNINLLSGGEKTLTAIALMFAVLKAKPTPFCILDEVEAALDDANIERFINCLRKFSGIQFALVTHQKATMEHADALYGVTMPEKGVSKVLSLDLSDDLSAYNG
ncbi:MAG: chromosome segregation protein SMC [Clostridiales bacterium]|nr:chromosome segregation protein SMC [Clostridiales bacterium]MDD7036147.1 chromosome segregation protein SMC [Bacillota bacterium]MDY2921193.1 chromosome segregation protein SMC [Lentihominibacter sp.]